MGAHTGLLYLLEKEVIYAAWEFTEGPALAGPSLFGGGMSAERFVLIFDLSNVGLDGR